MESGKSSGAHENYKVVFFKSPPSEGEEDTYGKAFREDGFETQFVPTLSFSFCNKAALKQAITQPDNYTGLLLTSKRAVEAVARCFDDEQSLAEWKECYAGRWSSGFVCGVGAATVAAATTELGVSCQFGDSGNAEGLAASLIEALQPSSRCPPLAPFLFPCSSLRRDVLITKLCKAGYSVEEVVSYETVAAPNFSVRANQLLDEMEAEWSERPEAAYQVTWLVFFSPSGVNLYVEAVRSRPTEQQKSHPGVKIAAIGKTTADALAENSLKPDAVAKKPSPEHLLDAISQCTVT